MKKINTKQRIIESAIPIFREKGFDGTTIQEICKAASVNKHTFYYYFKSKSDLLEDYSDYDGKISPQMFASIMNAENYVEQIWIVFERMIDFAIKSGPAIFKKISMLDSSEKVGAFKPDRIKTLYSSVSPLIQKGKDTGEFLTKIDNGMLFILFLEAFHGTATWSIWDNNFDFEKMMRIIYENLFDVAENLRISDRPEYNKTREKVREFLLFDA